MVEIIELGSWFPEIEIFNGKREAFISDFAKGSEVIIFTGKYENALYVLKQTKPDLFIFNGSGHNPLVVTDSADIDLAVEKCVMVKTFNNGQDCAGPDNILIHESISEAFIDKLKKKVEELKIGDYKDGAVIGSIPNREEICDVVKFIQNHSKDIIHGGEVSIKDSIVYPTIILNEDISRSNFCEIFAPVFFLTKYRTDSELSTYFEDSRYLEHSMYLSLFGKSNYINKDKHRSIVLHDQIVMDIEKGNDRYGGYSKGASFVLYGGEQHIMPTLIPRDISNYLEYKKNRVSTRNIKKVNKQIAESFTKAAEEVFQDNLEFFFFFGSFCKGTLDYSKDSCSDIDTFVCIKEEDLTQKEKYIERVKELHNDLGFSVDPLYPTEIVVKTYLEDFFKKEIDIDIHQLSSSDADAIFYTQILAGKKTSVIGDKTKLAEFTSKAISYRSLITSIIIEQLKGIDNIEYFEMPYWDTECKKVIFSSDFENYDEDEILFYTIKFPRNDTIENER